jgi:hypothetical protein
VAAPTGWPVKCMFLGRLTAGVRRKEAKSHPAPTVLLSVKCQSTSTSSPAGAGADSMGPRCSLPHHPSALTTAKSQNRERKKQLMGEYRQPSSCATDVVSDSMASISQWFVNNQDRKMRISHLTINTGRLSSIEDGDIPGEVLARVRPWLSALLKSGHPLPIPTARLSDDTAVAFDVEDALVTTAIGQPVDGRPPAAGKRRGI